MFIDTYIAVPLWIFGVFGLLYFMLRVFDSLGITGKRGRGPCTLVISARDQEEVIEGVVRGFILRNGLNGTEEELLNIVLVDLGSSDKTPRIMHALSRKYSIIRLIKPDDLTAYFKNILYRRR